MNEWKLNFLGAPGAWCGGQQARLRSKETWAVLASLTMPVALRGESAIGIGRETLADRFWSDSETTDPRTHLRQCLTSLRKAFGQHSLITDRQDVRIAPGWFTLDIDIVLRFYRKALKAESLDERLYWLTEAE